MLDPWYNKGVGGVVTDAEYDAFIDKLLAEACAISQHVYLWGFPEILGPFVRRIPSSHRLTAWLTWYYKNNPSVIRGWRSAQMTCLHLATPAAPMYPQHFLNAIQKEKLAEGKLRYLPGPTSVIEGPLNIGFVGKNEQTGYPAQKPLAVYDKLIRMVTVEGDLVFDPMCGSGTTGAVALIRGRRAILADMSVDYVGITKERLAADHSQWAARLDLIGNNPDKPRAPNNPQASQQDLVLQPSASNTPILAQSRSASAPPKRIAKRQYRKLVVSLSDSDRARIASLLRGGSPRDVEQRVRVLQYLDNKETPPTIGRVLGLTPDMVRTIGWRYLSGGLEQAIYSPGEGAKMAQLL